MTLGEFLCDQMGNAKPWNCSTMPADWCLALGYPDFAAVWRCVTNAADAKAAHVAPGQLLQHWRDGIGSALPVVDVPEAGDIAVVAAKGRESGAIYTGRRWALRGQRAVHFFATDQVDLMQAWRP